MQKERLYKPPRADRYAVSRPPATKHKGISKPDILSSSVMGKPGSGYRAARSRYIRWATALIIILSGVWTSWAGAAGPTVIHFSPADSLSTIGKTLSKALAGTWVVLSPGIYQGQLKIARAKGISTHPITLSGGNGVILEAWDSTRQNRDGYGTCGILIEKSAHVVVTGITITGAERGITIGGSTHIQIQNCDIHDIRHYGIMNYRSSQTGIIGNRISRSLKEHGIYISGAARQITIQDNRIEKTHINGIHCNGKIQGCTIERNQLHDIGIYPFPEGGAAITLIKGVSRARVRNNIFVNIHGQGMTLNGTDIEISNNLFHDVAWSILLGLPGASRIFFTNNMIMEDRAVPFQITPDVLTTFASDYNYFKLNRQRLYESKDQRLNWTQWQQKGFDRHSLRHKKGSPFIQPIPSGLAPIETYRLNPSSPAVDGGCPDLEDRAMPPGLGSRRSDMGIHGGPANANQWRL